MGVYSINYLDKQNMSQMFLDPCDLGLKKLSLKKIEFLASLKKRFPVYQTFPQRNPE